MNGSVLLDTGPLVAYVNHRDSRHTWSRTQFGLIRPPMWTCEPVLTEACYLLRLYARGIESIMELLKRRVVVSSFSLDVEQESVASLLYRYRELPMSLADACLVRMSEQHRNSKILTIDREFQIYRKHSRQVIPVLMPET